MKLTITAHGKTTTIETEDDDLDMQNVMQELIIPALLSVGYGDETVKDFIKLEEY